MTQDFYAYYITHKKTYQRRLHNEYRLEEMERSYIIKTLEKCAWKVGGEGGAARLLGLKPTTLHSKMKKLGIRRKITVL